MLPLSEELRQAAVELRTWARLHRTKADDGLGIWRALTTIDKAQRFIARVEEERFRV